MDSKTKSDDMVVMQFVPLKSFVNPTFWHKLAEIKLDIDKLSDAPKTIYGYYTNNNAKSCLLEVDYSAFNSDFKPPKHNISSYGTLYNKNTIEDFKECNKVELLHLEGTKLLEDIASGRILKDPRLLSRFIILSFADIKTHKYYYWFAFPCLLYPNVRVPYNFKPTRLGALSEFFSSFQKLDTSTVDNKNNSYFIVQQNGANLKQYHLCDLISLDFTNNFLNVKDINNIYFCFADPCEFEKPSWLLRSYITFICETCPNLREKVVNFLGIRVKNGNIENSLIWSISLPAKESSEDKSTFIGWEANQNGKMGPRIAAMATTMDSAKLAENSTNLNLKLMKWRIVPDLNLDIIAKQKCLLFGAGTLGCAVARNLLAWGFNTITFIDNGKISFSNPVRQTLYQHKDAVSGKSMKATTAAERTKEINPNTISEGYVLHIPMPSHPIGDSVREEIIGDLKKIEDLVGNHDVIFLLTDSRESRWLPTLLGAAHRKIVINAALGFDSYLVMRHGCKNETRETNPLLDIGDMKIISGSDLGCYFCNDVTAPGNSLKDRTLDQQCTVTRPGVSNIAASYAVELLVSLLQHPEKGSAPAYFSSNVTPNTVCPEGILGIIPHSIRGMLCNFENILPATSKFMQCIACSDIILNEYKNKKFEFLNAVFENAKYLEDLTGITSYEDLENEIIECDDFDFE